MYIVVDNNILISAIIGVADDSPIALIYDAILYEDNRFKLVISDEYIAELKRVLHYDEVEGKTTSQSEVGALINHINRIAKKVITESEIVSEELYDPDDNFLIAICEAAFPDNLITGDHRAGLLQRDKVAGVKVLTAAQFAEAYLNWESPCLKGSLDALSDLNDDHYMIQLALSKSLNPISDAEKLLASFIVNSNSISLEIPGHYWIIPTFRAKHQWFIFVLGSYNSRKFALDVMVKLKSFSEVISKIKEIKNSKPLVRKVRSVKQDWKRHI